jgi:hypothetical protein
MMLRSMAKSGFHFTLLATGGGCLSLPVLCFAEWAWRRGDVGNVILSFLSLQGLLKFCA